MWWIAIVCVLGLAAWVLASAFVCFRLTFYAPDRKTSEEYPIPPGAIYEPHRETMVAWIKEMRAMEHEEVSIHSFDGLTLRGRYYEYAPGAPIELMFHGYRGTADRDLCGGVQRCFALQRSALIVDQRASGRSDGHIISFGINESRDCQAWIEFMIERFGADVRIVLCGISMGAATVLMASGRELPPNVVGVLADCGYNGARDIICKVIRDLHLPAKLLYPFVRLGACLFGRFDPEADSPVEAMKRCRVPVIFFHGDTDAFVPCDMSRQNYEACTSHKRLVVTPGAGHGLCYMIDKEGYLDALREFDFGLQKNR